MMQEIDLLKNLNHKNIVKYLGSLKTKTHLHIILEYVENGSLANIIKPNKFGPFPESLVALYISQVLEGLVYLHEQGVIHRDIKGANILTTKEGLVKLADFGVATKLTEADVNTHSVVGTPYWMAPEVIEMSGVCAASDIWSVGCTVIELLTCVPPYYDLQPMPALFRIVQDKHPPIPDSLSSDISDFLRQCFKKDARQRPDAKTLLSHPWIQNCRRALHSSLRHSGTLRNTQQDESTGAEISNGDDQNSCEILLAEKNKAAGSDFKADSRKELLSDVATDTSKSPEHFASGPNFVEEGESLEEDTLLDQVPTLSIHESSSLLIGSCTLATSEPTESHESQSRAHDEVIMNGKVPVELRKDASRKHGENETSTSGNRSFVFGSESQDNSFQKVSKMSIALGGNELSKFSDTPGDASLDDLFQPLDKLPGDQAAEASTSLSTPQSNIGDVSVNDVGKNDLASKLRATIAQKQMENEMVQANGGGNLLRLVMGVYDVDIGGLVFDEKLQGENLYPLPAVEFGRLVGSLRPDEPEDVIVSACQKLIAIFRQRPEQKIVYVTQHGLLPLMELLEVPKTRIICSVLQLINQIVKDNGDFQENACLVGLIPLVMGFSVPDRPREVRMEAAYFFQQLCQSSSLTLQMFVACRGIPVLVSFLEADYAKYREMVHLAIDGMWQIFKLQRSTLRNGFCRIAAKSGILLRLINTLYSLNEATRLASITIGTGNPVDGLTQRPRSGQLDSSHPIFSQYEATFPMPDQTDLLKVKHGIVDHHLPTGTPEPSRASTSHSQRSDANQSDHRNFSTDADRPQSSNATNEVLGTFKPSELASLEKVVNLATNELPGSAPREHENVDRWKTERMANSTRTSTDKPPKMVEPASNGFLTTLAAIQQEQVRPLLSLLEKEPPSRHFSGQLEYVHHFSGLERHETIMPLLHASNEKKINGESDFLMAEFAEVSQRGKDNGNLDPTSKASLKSVAKKVGTPVSNEQLRSSLQNPRPLFLYSSMARKRKLKSSDPAEPSKKLQQQPQPTIDDPKPQEEPVKEVVPEDPAEYEVVEEEDDSVQEESEEEEDDEEEDDDEDGEENGDVNLNNNHQTPNVPSSSVAVATSADDDDDPIQTLLEPFSKDQLINLLREAAEKHADVNGRIRMVADADPSHRKIFVHGLGWDTTTESLINVFKGFGEIEDCKAVCDKVSGKSKGYGFILFKKRSGARKALKEPQKKIGSRMTACQLASIGPVPTASAAVTPQGPPASEYTQRKIYVSNVGADVDTQKLLAFFSQFGAVEDGPLGLDKITGKPKGFCLFVYKTIESARKALEEPHKNFEGHVLHCQRAIDGAKPGKPQHQQHTQSAPFQRNKNLNYTGGAASGSGHLMAPAGPGVGYNQAPPQALNPAIGQALTALLASQGAGLGLTNLLGTLGSTAGMNPTVQGGGPGVQSGYGSQTNISPGMIGYGGQSSVQGGYPNPQMGQGGTGRGGQHGVGQYGGYMGH